MNDVFQEPWVDFRLVAALACLTLLFPILGVIVNALGGAAVVIALAESWIWLSRRSSSASSN